MKDILVTSGAWLLVLTALFFFVHKPEVENSFNQGLSECKEETRVEYIKGDTVEIVKEIDHRLPKQTKVSVNKNQKGQDRLTTWFDSTIVSGKDTISLMAQVVIEDGIASWLPFIKHIDVETIRTDTVKVYTPRFVDKIQYENNWLLTGISYIAGIISVILILIFTG